MRRIILFLLFVTQIAFGQLYAPGVVGSTTNSSTNNVGIGTMVPTEKLDVAGYDKINIRVGQWATLGIIGSHLSTVLGNNVKASSVNNNMEILTSSADGAKAIKMQYNEGITFHTLQASVTSGAAFSSERMRIDNSGNVGIGLTGAAAKLHVAGCAYFGNQNGDSWYRVSIGGSGSNYGSIGYGFRYTLNNNEFRYAVADYASQLEFRSGGFSFNTAPLGVVDNVVNFSTAMRIDQTGNVGIGTSTPGSFKLAVNGKIWSQEVNVAMTNPGPDYVFEKEYNLLPLAEVENYIKANKHLPEVPSAKEMESDGLNLKEMNLLLLKKVEELTLHLIAKDKKITALEERVQALEENNEFITTIKSCLKIMSKVSITDASNDSGVSPLMVFDSRQSSAPISTRPLFAWDSYGTRKMTMTANGNLGIGTNSPPSLLTLNRSGSGAQTSELLIQSNASGVARFGWNAAGYVDISSLINNNHIVLSPNGTGNVGIGTTAPDYRLHIKDGNGGAQLKFQRGSGIARIAQDNNTDDLYIDAPAGLLLNVGGGNVGIGTTVPDYRLHIKDGIGGAQLKFQRGTGFARIMQDNNTDDLYIEAPAGLLLNTGGGNVGIGTTNTGSFRLAVNGKIWSQEVNVAMTNPGPDYVFEKDYNLLPLAEVENYIKQNKHLPEVPSAKEMEEEGLNLKEMNLLLLKKVEELTLHMIEANKKIDRLESDNAELRQVNE